MTIDHIVPRARGGSDNVDNLVCCCKDCNVLKDDKTIEEYTQNFSMTAKKHYLNRINQMFEQGCISYEKHELLLGYPKELNRGVINIRLPFLRFYCNIYVGTG